MTYWLVAHLLRHHTPHWHSSAEQVKYPLHTFTEYCITVPYCTWYFQGSGNWQHILLLESHLIDVM